MEATDRQREHIGQLIEQYAQLKHVTCAKVAHALMASKTLSRLGYEHTQKGRLTDEQADAAIRVLDYWIGAAIEERSAENMARIRQARRREIGEL